MVQWILTLLPNCPVTHEVVEEAARGGHLWALQLLEGDENCAGIQWRDETSIFGDDMDSISYAANGEHWAVVEWLLDHSDTTRKIRRSNNSVVLHAYEQCSLERVNWAIAKGFGANCLICYDFEKYTEERWKTRTDIVKYILEGGFGDAAVIADDVLQQLAQADDWKIYLYLRSKRGRGRSDYNDICLLQLASAFNSIRVMDWVLASLERSSEYNAPAEAMFAGVECGNLKSVKWLYQRFVCDPNFDLFHRQGYGQDTKDYIMDIAAEKGYINVLKFLQHAYVEITKASEERDADWSFVFGPAPECSSRAMDAAAKKGHYDAVNYLRANRSEGCTNDAMNEAAANGHVRILMLLNVYGLEGR